jgi:MYXO-CTERM domain-containing protein
VREDAPRWGTLLAALVIAARRRRRPYCAQ